MGDMGYPYGQMKFTVKEHLVQNNYMDDQSIFILHVILNTLLHVNFET